MTVKYKGIKWPSWSNIDAETRSKEWMPPWATKCVIEWIKENCDKKEEFYQFHEDDLPTARWYYKSISQRAMDIGTEAHDAVRMFLVANKKPVGLSDSAQKSFDAFLKFYKEHKMETIKTEERLFLTDWCLQYDWYGKLDGILYVIDLKTSTKIKKEMGIQTASYRYGMKLNGYEVDGNAVIRLDKETGKFEFKDFSRDYDKCLREFLISKELYFLRKPRIASQFNRKTPF